ncbi:hypothetical protein [Amycolatopsis australiensis]|nr:hypothetical protein [Amycolatopsis australiensis]
MKALPRRSRGRAGRRLPVDPQVLLLPAGHRLAAREPVEPGELAGEEAA